MTPAGDKLDRLLARAIDDLGPKGNTTMHSMQRLVAAAGDLKRRVEARADAAADRIEKAKQRAEQAVGRFEDFATEVERSADEIERDLGQISNMPPLPESEQL